MVAHAIFGGIFGYGRVTIVGYGEVIFFCDHSWVAIIGYGEVIFFVL